MKDHEWMKYSISPWWWGMYRRSDMRGWYSEMLNNIGQVGAPALYRIHREMVASGEERREHWKSLAAATAEVTYAAWAFSGEHTTLLTLPVMRSLWKKRLVSKKELEELPLSGVAFEVVFQHPISVSGGERGGVRSPTGNKKEGCLCTGGVFHACPVEGWTFVPNLLYNKDNGLLLGDTPCTAVHCNGGEHHAFHSWREGRPILGFHGRNSEVRGGPPASGNTMHDYAHATYLRVGATENYSPNALLLNALRALHDRRVAYTEPFLASPRKRKKSSRRVKNPARLSILVLGPKAESVYQIRSNRVGTDEPSTPRKPMCRHQVQPHTTIKWVLAPRPDEEVIERRIRRSAVVDGQTIHTYIYAVRRGRKGFARGVGESVFTPKLTILQGS
tara:strand:- start:138 stop:1304 length:1167 start_codon:yes stop_codon:yes gene_type:complete